MDDVLWLLIGLGGGALLAALLPHAASTGRSTAVRRQLAVTAAGAIGAVLAARGLVLGIPAAAADSLTTAAAALAGSLWVASAVGIALVRRRRGDDSHADMVARARARTPVHGFGYDATRQAMVDGFAADAIAHDAGRYADMGRWFADARRAIPDDSAQTTKLHTALRFWQSWMQARDAQWSTLDFPDGIPIGDWPELARTIMSDLALDRELSDPRVRDHFAAGVFIADATPDRPHTTSRASSIA